MYVISTKPDLGNLLSEFMDRGDEVKFPNVDITSVMRMGPKRYVATTWTSWEGEHYAVTFYLKQAALDSLLSCASEVDRSRINDQLGGGHRTFAKADLPELHVAITAKLGKTTWGLYEKVTPFTVTDLKPLEAMYQAGTYESWEAGGKFPDFGTHLLRTRPDLETYRFPGMGLTDIVYMGDECFLALGFTCTGKLTYSVTLELDREMLGHLVECSVLRDDPEAREVLLGHMDPHDSVGVMGLTVDFECRIGDMQTKCGINYVPFIVTDLRPTEEE